LLASCGSGSPPQAPTFLQVTGTTYNSITLSWVDNSNDESFFNVERANNSGPFTFLRQVPSNTQTYTDSSLSSNINYYYRVYVSSSAGNSSYSNVVLATTARGWQVTTLAGMAGYPGYSDGTGTEAQFSSLNYITTDGTNFYTADGNGVRKVVISTGMVTTLSLSISFQSYGITTDGANLYVADTYNHTILKVVIATGEVTTIAGSAGNAGYSDGTGPEAKFFGPRGITTDGTNLYVADTENQTIRKVVISTGEVTTLAGMVGSVGWSDGTGSEAKFEHSYDITTDGTNLYVLDVNMIQKVAISTRVVTTLAGLLQNWGSSDGTGTEAQFSSLNYITTDGTNLYVADTGKNMIRIVNE